MFNRYFSCIFSHVKMKKHPLLTEPGSNTYQQRTCLAHCACATCTSYRYTAESLQEQLYLPFVLGNPSTPCEVIASSWSQEHPEEDNLSQSKSQNKSKLLFAESEQTEHS